MQLPQVLSVSIAMHSCLANAAHACQALPAKQSLMQHMAYHCARATGRHQRVNSMTTCTKWCCTTTFSVAAAFGKLAMPQMIWHFRLHQDCWSKSHTQQSAQHG